MSPLARGLGHRLFAYFALIVIMASQCADVLTASVVACAVTAPWQCRAGTTLTRRFAPPSPASGEGRSSAADDRHLTAAISASMNFCFSRRSPTPCRPSRAARRRPRS